MIRYNILLRPLKQSDAITIAELANNKKVADNLRDLFPYPYHEHHAKAFIEFTQKENPQVTFGIEYKKELCGVIGLVIQPDVYKVSAEIGYWIGEPFWGNGIATVAVGLITEYGFTQLSLVRIHTGIFEYNIPSMKVLEKNGYMKECVFEKAIFKNGKIWDEHRYAKIR